MTRAGRYRCTDKAILVYLAARYDATRIWYPVEDAANHPTVADIACFPYIMLSEEGGISRQDYPAIRRWCDRVKRIEGFIVMPGVFLAGPALTLA